MRPLLRRTVDLQTSPMTLDELADDAEPKSGTFVSTGEPAIDLTERPNRQFNLLGGHADPGVGNAYPGTTVFCAGNGYADRRIWRAEFCCVRQQLEKHLFNRSLVRMNSQ